ncbi:MAG: AAA family ATPase [Agathobacter sp.]|nr:AAA family ATPase [Lachnospiraceae bacterium]MBQ6811490.1 AAA family ATPase [Agathobacter sp.]
MQNNVGIGIQDFLKLREQNHFYVDKTPFIKEWWESGDDVTLITRPRRFGKTLNMSMVEEFFSVDYAERGDLFEGLSIWEEEKYQKLQGTYPVISLSFAKIKESNYQMTRKKICRQLTELYAKNAFLLESDLLYETEREYFNRVNVDMDDADATIALNCLSDYLYRYYGKKVIILLDEYDTPMQEAYVNGFWEDMVAFTRSLFNSTFKTNPYMARGIMTGITRVSKEGDFSGLNNLKVITTTSDEYATSFGFTEEEVFASLDQCGLGEEKENVKEWYDGFVFGEQEDIYNPWSIINFLDTGKYATYWVNTSSNSLVGNLIREGDREIKQSMEQLLKGEHLICPIDEQIVYNQLDNNEEAIWSLMVASGYLKILDYEDMGKVERQPNYELAITNKEIRIMFDSMISGWFGGQRGNYNRFITAMLIGDVDEMNEYMNEISCEIFSYFDTGKRVSKKARPERFYHGFVLGLMVDLKGRYLVTSNRESGFGRYDIMLEPVKPEQDDAIIIEFKVFNPRKEKSLEETLASALAQIEEKQYEASLIARGISKDRIHKYGFAFEGKNVLIG